MGFSQEKLVSVKVTAAGAGPCVVEEIQSCTNWKVPTFFTCSSGVLLWGQLSTVMEGYLGKEDEPETKLGPYHRIKPGVDGPGTVLQRRFRYRAQARKGVWKVEGAFYRGSTRLFGYVCHHVDANGPDILRRAALVGVSLRNDHEDRDIVYVNRYDWSNHGCPYGCGSCPYGNCKLMAGLMNLKDENEEEDEEKEEDSCDYSDYETTSEDKVYKERYEILRFMLVDEQGFPQLAQSLVEGFKPDDKNYLFKDKLKGDAPGDAFGFNLVVGDEGEAGCELGWMAFESGELVGFVFDGYHTRLEGKSYLCGDIEVEVPRPHEPYFEELKALAAREDEVPPSTQSDFELEDALRNLRASEEDWSFPGGLSEREDYENSEESEFEDDFSDLRSHPSRNSLDEFKRSI